MARLAAGDEVFLLDVREPDEVEAWAYPVGVNIPMGAGRRPAGRTAASRSDHGGLPCRGRSAAVAAALSDAGWSAENLTGGAVAWEAATATPDVKAPDARNWVTAQTGEPFSSCKCVSHLVH